MPATAPAGAGGGTARLDAGLRLSVPPDTAAGTYTGTLTPTAGRRPLSPRTGSGNGRAGTRQESGPSIPASSDSLGSVTFSTHQQLSM
ncbi:hypothetical protein GCM10025331_50960 [Actinoplanes utahensis]|nr:hypothetical protein Aut01nite_65240 [Actinoplanes utahensis]